MDAMETERLIGRGRSSRRPVADLNRGTSREAVTLEPLQMPRRHMQCRLSLLAS